MGGKPRSRYPLVAVTWIDSAAHYGWMDDLDKLVPTLVESVGYLLVDDRTRVVITIAISSFGSFSDPMAIPREAVRSIRRLKG